MAGKGEKWDVCIHLMEMRAQCALFCVFRYKTEKLIKNIMNAIGALRRKLCLCVYQTPTKTAPNLLRRRRFGAVCISGHLPVVYQ